MNTEERAYEEHDELLTKLQRLLKQLSDKLSREEQQQMQKIADNPEFAIKYDPNQPRDDHGRFTTVGGDTSSEDGKPSETSKPGGKSGMDMDKAVNRLNKSAEKNHRSTGECAKYVRLAIMAGGVALKPEGDRYPNAKDYGPYLEKYNFEKVTPDKMGKYSFEKGDIAVF